MPHKTRPPIAGDDRRPDKLECAAREATHRHHTPTPSPPTRPGELARAPHSDTVCVVVTETKDRGRISIETWTRRDAEWLLGGFAPSLPVVLIDTVVDALHQARDRRAGTQ